MKHTKDWGNFGEFIFPDKCPVKSQKDKQYNNYILILKEKLYKPKTMFFTICPDEK